MPGRVGKPRPGCAGVGFAVKPVTAAGIDDLATLFGSSRVTAGCWCMWFIVPVKESHAAGSEGNRRQFCELAEHSDVPVGLLAYRDGVPVGWCATGPRTRYARAIRTPTFAGRDPDEDAAVWLVPCFFIHRDARRAGAGHALLAAAVDLARTHGATAIEGFPYAAGKRRASGDIYVGVESMFTRCGFHATRRPSPARVVMRRDLP